MTIYDIILYSLLLFGSMLGIAAGIYIAFETALRKLDGDDSLLFVKWPTAKSAFDNGREKPGKRQSRFTLWREKRKREHEEKIGKKTGRETEAYKSLKQKVAARDNVNSFTDSSCAICERDAVKRIEDNRKCSNNAYQYMQRKKRTDDS